MDKVTFSTNISSLLSLKRGSESKRRNINGSAKNYKKLDIDKFSESLEEAKFLKELIYMGKRFKNPNNTERAP